MEGKEIQMIKIIKMIQEYKKRGENHMKRNLFFIIFLLIGILNAKIEIEIPYLNNAPKIDGEISEHEWTESIMYDQFVQTSPGDNSMASEKTEFFMGYDNDNLYYLAKCYMENPAEIRDYHCSRDRIYTTDRVMVFLDTFESNSKAYYVVANRHGEQADGIVLDNIDPSIDFNFYSMGSLTEYGWIVEISIPFKSLKYKSGENVQWGGFLKRAIPAKNEEITFPVKRGGGNFYDNYAIFKFADLPTNQRLKISPSIIGNYQKNDIDDEISSDTEVEPELNIFYEPNSNLTTTVTINPDFNIIEADGMQVSANTRFPMYYGEKRPFFIEETNPFYTDINIYHTRNIVAPKWGAKLTGSFNDLSVFALGAVDADTPAARFFDVDDETSDTKFGFFATSKKYNDGESFIRLATSYRGYGEYDNVVFNLDNSHRFCDVLTGEFQLLGSFNEEYSLKNEIVGLDTVLTANVENQKGYAYAYDFDYFDGNWYCELEGNGLSKDFTADMGYVYDKNYHFFSNKVEYQIHAKTDKDFVRYMEFASTQSFKRDFKMDKLLEYYWEPMIGAMFQNKLDFWTGMEMQMIHYRGQDNKVHYPWFSINYKPLRSLEGSFTIVGGKNLYYNANVVDTYRKFEGSITIRPHRFLDIETKYKFHETENYYTANVYEVIAKVQFHKDFWLRLIYQSEDIENEYYNSQHISHNLYPMFTYKPNVTTAIYLGASSNLENGDFKNDNEIQKYDDKVITYFLKVSHSFEIF